MQDNLFSNTRAVIFDMDGVLVDTEPLYINVNQQLFKKLDIAISVEEQLTFVGISSTDMWRIIRQKFGLAQSVETLFQLETDAFCHAIKSLQTLEPMPGVVTLINALRTAGRRFR